jgi:hypothetical protein
MNDERRNDVGGVIVVGCLAVGVLFGVLAVAAAVALFYVRSSVVHVQKKPVATGVQSGQQPQVSVEAEKEKEIPPEATPELK